MVIFFLIPPSPTNAFSNRAVTCNVAWPCVQCQSRLQPVCATEGAFRSCREKTRRPRVSGYHTILSRRVCRLGFFTSGLSPHSVTACALSHVHICRMVLHLMYQPLYSPTSSPRVPSPLAQAWSLLPSEKAHEDPRMPWPTFANFGKADHKAGCRPTDPALEASSHLEETIVVPA